jgi:protein-S-isoprenylcysteine O-methyltransferase Ste14
VLVGVIMLCARALIRAPHARRATVVEADAAYVTSVERVVLVLGVVGLSALPLIYLAMPAFDALDYELPGWMAGIGALVAGAGLWVFHRSHHDLGQHWSATLRIGQHHRLVTRGIYEWVRHPMYAPIWLQALAQALLFQNWLAGPAGAVVVDAMYLLRLPREEAMMRNVFGQAYTDYCSRTGRLIPRFDGLGS